MYHAIPLKMFPREGAANKLLSRGRRVLPHSPLQSPLNSPSPTQVLSPASPSTSSPYNSPPNHSMAPSPHNLQFHHHLSPPSSYLKHGSPHSPSADDNNMVVPNLLPSSPAVSHISLHSPCPNSPPNSYGGYHNGMMEPAPHSPSSSISVSSVGGNKRMRMSTTPISALMAQTSNGGNGSVMGEWSVNSPGGNGSIGSMSPTPHSLVMSPESTTSTGTCSPSPRPGQDDVSSPNSYDSSATNKRYKKGPTPRQQEDLCLVCGDRASGYHYNALTCEGCKGFFRRSITKKAVYTCKYGMRCEIDMYMRRKCQECRFKKCITIGMREECVIPEGACQKKREQKKAREREKLKSASPDDEITKVIKMGVKGELLDNNLLYENNYIPENQSYKFDSVRLPWNPYGEDQVQLNSAQADLINRLLFTQELFEVPTNENHKSMKTTETPSDESSAQFTHITSMTVVTVQLIVEFAKRVPGFDTLLQNDQIVLLKACTSEVIMLRAARRYDAKTDSIVFGNNFPYKREAYNMAGMVPEITNTLFEFCARMARMKVDNAEYALLTAISIFSERPMLSDPKKVDRLQELFVLALQMYTNKKYDGNAPAELGKLMSILTELRTLAHLNNKQCYTIKKNNKLPDFLLELWDLNSDCS